MIETITVRPLPTPATPALGRGQAAPPEAEPPKAAPPEKAGLSLWGDDGFGFDDFLDAVNPLQHIPLIGTLYREIVGDEIGVVSRLVGGALFAGIPGLIGSAVDAAFEAISGKDIGATALAFVGLGQEDSAGGTAPTALAAKTLGGTGGEKMPTFAAAQFANPLALLSQTDDRKPKNTAQTLAAQTAAMQAQNFAARFDRETSAYRHGQRLLSQPTPSLETTA